MSEIIEHELNKLNGAVVTVVRPSFGKVSDSWRGTLTSIKDSYPLRFVINSPNLSMLFEATDVVSVEPRRKSDSLNGAPVAIIRFKGPNDYRNEVHPEEIPIKTL